MVVNGWPWNTVVATHLTISATLPDGRAYRNEGMQLLRLRWGRVVEDLIFEDTLKLDAELKRMQQRRRRAGRCPMSMLHRFIRWLGSPPLVRGGGEALRRASGSRALSRHARAG